MNKSVKMALLFTLVVSNSCFSIGLPNFKLNQNVKVALCLMVGPMAVLMGLTAIGHKTGKKEESASNVSVKKYTLYEELESSAVSGFLCGIAATSCYFKFLKQDPQEIITKFVVEKGVPALVELVPQPYQSLIKLIKK